MIELQNSIYTTPGVDSKHLGPNIVSADLAVVVMDREHESKEVLVAIHIRMALQKPIMIFHALDVVLPPWIEAMRHRMYVNDHHHAPILAYSTVEQMTEAFEKYVRSHCDRPVEACRVVF